MGAAYLAAAREGPVGERFGKTLLLIRLLW